MRGGWRLALCCAGYLNTDWLQRSSVSKILQLRYTAVISGDEPQGNCGFGVTSRPGHPAAPVAGPALDGPAPDHPAAVLGPPAGARKHQGNSTANGTSFHEAAIVRLKPGSGKRQVAPRGDGVRLRGAWDVGGPRDKGQGAWGVGHGTWDMAVGLAGAPGA